MTDETLENFKQHGIKITFKTRWLYWDENTWVVTGLRYPREPRSVLYHGLSYHDAFNVLLNG
jgi:hypothetical protein